MTEAGATQTLQTSSQLTSLSTSLTRLVQATWRSTMEFLACHPRG